METLFEDLVNEIVTDSKTNEVIPETENSDSVPATNNIHPVNFVESSAEKKGPRRGVWKRIRVRPLDGFETAESQNYGQQYINHIPSVDLKEEKVKQFDSGLTTTTTIEVAATSEAEVETAKPTIELETHTEVPVVADSDSTSTSTTTTSETETISTTEPIPSTDAPIEITTTALPDEHSYIITTIRPTVDSKFEETTKHVQDENDVHVTERIAAETAETPYYDDYDTERILTETQNENHEDDQLPESSNIFSDVKQRLSDLFGADSDYDYQENNLPLKMQQYTTIERTKSLNQITDDESDKKTEKPLDVVTEPTSSFHKNLMDSVIYATSTSTEISHETEICYRGRCIKTDKKLKT